MPIELHVVDAFTIEPFRGNPAAVCLPDRQLADAFMQAVAAEMNLSETATTSSRASSPRPSASTRTPSPAPPTAASARTGPRRSASLICSPTNAPRAAASSASRSAATASSSAARRSPCNAESSWWGEGGVLDSELLISDWRAKTRPAIFAIDTRHSAIDTRQSAIGNRQFPAPVSLDLPRPPQLTGVPVLSQGVYGGGRRPLAQEERSWHPKTEAWRTSSPAR
jgi:hypothetical protein